MDKQIINKINDFFIKEINKKRKKSFFLQDIFLLNIDLVKNLLKEGLSFRAQALEFSKDVQKISESSYVNFCKKFLPNEYKKSLSYSVFFRNLFLIREYLLSPDNNKSCYELYGILEKRDVLRENKKNRSSNIKYEIFSSIMKEKLLQINCENHLTYLVEKDENINLNTKNEDGFVENNIELTSSKKEDMKKTDKVTNISDKNIKKQIKIELLNDEPNEFSHKYLMCSVVTLERDINIVNEKNYLAIGVRYKGKDFDIEAVKEKIIKKQLLKDYELFMFNGSAVDLTVKFFRMYQGELIEVAVMPSSCLDFSQMRDYFNAGQKKLFALLPEILE